MLLTGLRNIVMRFKRYIDMQFKMFRQPVRASATLEAALVIPLYVYAVLAVMYVIRFVNVYIDVDRALYNSARELAGYAYEYNENGNLGMLKAQLYTSFISDIGMFYGKDNYIVGGTMGINLSASYVCDDGSQIDIRAGYVVKNPFDIFGIGLIHVEQGVTAEAWLGEDAGRQWSSSSGSGRDGDDELRKVYVTPWGRVYHTDSGCSAIDLSIEEVSSSAVDGMRNADGGKYYPCEGCGGNPDGTVYITDYGDRYHTDINCSGLKRTVDEIDIRDVGDRAECKRCGGSHS